MYKHGDSFGISAANKYVDSMGLGRKAGKLSANSSLHKVGSVWEENHVFYCLNGAMVISHSSTFHD